MMTRKLALHTLTLLTLILCTQSFTTAMPVLTQTQQAEPEPTPNEPVPTIILPTLIQSQLAKLEPSPSAPSTTMTMPASVQARQATSSTLRFVVTGDSRGANAGIPINTEILSEIVTATISETAEFILFTGDLVYGSSNAATLESQLAAWQTVAQPLYDAGVGIYPVRGNHDAYSKMAWDNVFTGAYALPDNGPSGEENVTFSFTRTNALIVGLDQYANPNRVNQTWLWEQFASNTQPHVFVFGHEPAFAVNHTSCLGVYADTRNAFWSSITAEGGRVYFAEHDHFYNHARLDDGDGNPADDVHQFVVGTAGAPIYTWDNNYDGDNDPWTPQLVHNEGQWGYVLVEIDSQNTVTLTWKHRTAPGVYEPGGEVFTYTVAPKPFEWTAYNDLAWGDGQLEINITKFTSPNGGSDNEPHGNLVNYADGDPLTVTLTVTGGLFISASHAIQGAEPASGTDAHDVFNSYVSSLGAVSYVNQANSPLVLTLSNMDPTRRYNLVFFGNRDAYGWERASLATLSGAVAFTNQSSDGTDNNGDPLFSGPDDPSTQLPADNTTTTGYVASFTSIAPGSDGAVTLTTSFSGNVPYLGKYASALMLQEIVVSDTAPATAPATVTINGPTTGEPGQNYRFTATVRPFTTTTPITYTWQASGQTDVLTNTAALSHSVTYSWNTPGAQTITVTAMNALDAVSDTHTINVVPFYIYLPLAPKSQ